MSAPARLEITAMAFDLGNVLVKVDHWRFCRRLARLAAISPEAVFRGVFDTGLEPGYDTGSLSSRDFYQNIINHFRLTLSYPQFCDLWNDIFDPLAGMAEVVARLKSRYPLFLLSNTNALHFSYIQERFPLVRHFTRLILSYEVGSRKPEAEIYQALIRQAGCPPEQILFLDDKLPFVEAARSQGLRAWHFTSSQDLEQELQRHGLW